jgi:hydroxymethylbilane synthase
VSQRIVIATRGSALALWQANHTKARIEAVMPGLAVELSIIKTSGDMIQDVPLAKVGGKGLFVKEIEQALVDRAADLAVHSMKDVPAELAPGLVIAAVSARETPWDALCARAPVTLETLPQGAKVGTSSMRRQSQLLARRPDLKIEMLRGNVPTRLRKLDEGQFDAIVLAAAGLIRLGLGDRITQQLPLELSIPAVAQGVLAFEVREGDRFTTELVRQAMHDASTALCMAGERAFLARMGGSCQTPLAAHATLRPEGGIRIIGMCGMPDGTRILKAEMAGTAVAPEQAMQIGVRLAEDLIAQGAEEILAATKL